MLDTLCLPTVTLTSPTNNGIVKTPANITVSASASDADGSISKVVLYNGTTVLATLTSAPYNYNWNNVAIGSYAITAVAYDNMGAVSVSSKNNVQVDLTTGLDENSANNGIELYPNPVTSELNNVSLGAINLVTICNLQGQELLKSNESKFDLSSLSSGYYIVKIEQNSSVTIKIIIKK